MSSNTIGGSRTKVLVDKMINFGISGKPLIFAQKVIGCMDMRTDASNINIVTPVVNNGGKPNAVIIHYTTTTRDVNLRDIMQLICEGNNGITQATIQTPVDAKGVISLSITVENTLNPPTRLTQHTNTNAKRKVKGKAGGRKMYEAKAGRRGDVRCAKTQRSEACDQIAAMLSVADRSSLHAVRLRGVYCLAQARSTWHVDVESTM